MNSSFRFLVVFVVFGFGGDCFFSFGEIEIGTINDESEDNVEESKDGEAMPPTSKSAAMTSDGEELKSEEDPVRKSTL